MKPINADFARHCEERLSLAVENHKLEASSFVQFTIELTEKQACALKELFELIKSGELKACAVDFQQDSTRTFKDS